MKSKKIIFGLPILILILSSTLSFAQGEKSIDTRIWSISYWQQLAKMGLVKFNPVEPRKSIYTSSKITATGVVPADSVDIAVINATNTIQSENSVFIHPANAGIVLNSNNSSDWPYTTFYGSSNFNSSNNGQSWQGSIQGTGGTNQGDPAVAIDRNGRFYVNYIASDKGQGVARSTDNGAHWTSLQIAAGPPGPDDLLDKNHFWVDNNTTSAFQGYLYAAWTLFQSGSPDTGNIQFSFSTDQGNHWSTPVNISSGVNAGNHNQGVNIQTGPNGEVYAVWAVYDSWPSDETAIGFASSTDGGIHWSTARRIEQNIRGIRKTLLGGNKTMRVNSFPSMTVDTSGNIYVVWTNIGIPGTNTGDPDIYMIKSTNGGTNWNNPIRVNKDTAGNGRDQWAPWIAADPVTGYLACIFYDSRDFSNNDMAETFVSISKDSGSSWEDFKVSDFAWSGDGIPGFSKNYAGDYLGIAFQGGKIYPVWSDDRSGNMLAYTSPLDLNSTGACNPPGSGDWVVSSSCSFTGSARAPANVVVKAGVILTVNSTAALDMDIKNYHLTVESGGGVLVKQGGKIY